MDLINLVTELRSLPCARDVCSWNIQRHYDGDEYYMTDCEHAHLFFDGTPENNNYKFCPYCGGRLEVR